MEGSSLMEHQNSVQGLSSYNHNSLQNYFSQFNKKWLIWFQYGLS